MTDLTTWLAGARQGDSEVLGQLFSELYRDLRQLAHARLKHHGTFTLLDTTALVHESYLRFLKAGQVQFADRAHFMAYAARVVPPGPQLVQLATVSERLVRVVEMRYFAGMSDAEIGEALSLTERTVRRDWEKARIILRAALKT